MPGPRGHPFYVLRKGTHSMSNGHTRFLSFGAFALGLALTSAPAGAQLGIPGGGQGGFSAPVPQTIPVFDRADFTISPLETRVLGQRTWLRGGPAALRV